MTRRAWRDEEIGFLQDTMNWGLQQVAEALDRSPSSVTHMRIRLRSGWTPIMAPVWTEEEDRFLLATASLTALEVSKKITTGRSERAVSGRRKKLTQTHGAIWDFVKNPNHIGRRRLLAKTCPSCGLFLEARWFDLPRKSRGGWQNVCTRCRYQNTNQPKQQRTTDISSVSRTRLQAMTLPNATRHNQPFLDSDHEVLADPDLTVLEKALRLERTYNSAMSICQRSGYKSKVGLGDPVAGQWVIDNPNDSRLISA